MSLEKLCPEEIALVQAYLQKNFPKPNQLAFGLQELQESMNYSLHSSGKRFRPVLSVLTAKALGQAEEVVLPYAAAVEMIHTYSLSHDDLPAMDDDDERRGRPTNHRVYGEAMAILAGDSLLTEAFCLIARSYQNNSATGLQALGILAEAAGPRGMVGGQAADIKVSSLGRPVMDKDLFHIHKLKTGALIAAAVEGAAVLCEATAEQQQNLTTYGENLGLAFQLADDLLDHSDEEPEEAGFPALLGVDKTRDLLAEATQKAVNSLHEFGSKAQPLKAIAEFNQQRLQ